LSCARAHVKIRRRNISLFVAFTRPDDSVAVPRHEAFISKYVYRRCVQSPTRARVALINVEAFIKAARDANAPAVPLSLSFSL
jgi:hypothetical protein